MFILLLGGQTDVVRSVFKKITIILWLLGPSSQPQRRKQEAGRLVLRALLDAPTGRQEWQLLRLLPFVPRAQRKRHFLLGRNWTSFEAESTKPRQSHYHPNPRPSG